MRDIGASLLLDDGLGQNHSLYSHTALLGRLALQQFFRMGRGIPPGLFEEASLRFSPKMLGILPGGPPVVVVPVGEIPCRALDVVCRVCWEVFGLPVRILRQRPMWPDAVDEIRRKVDASRVLTRAEPFVAYGRVIVLTDSELFADIQKKETYVYGYGHMVETVCTVSIHGFGSLWQLDSHMSWARLVKVTVHELGHTFGLRHHDEEGTNDIPCVMNTVKQLDDGETGRIGLDFLTHEFCTKCLGDVMSGRSQYAEHIKKAKAKGDPACSLE